MKDLSLLVWLTQLGLCTALPLVGFVFLGVWLRQYWGAWILVVAIVVGIIVAIDGFWQSLKAMSRLAGKAKKEPPCVRFNDHD